MSFTRHGRALGIQDKTHLSAQHRGAKRSTLAACRPAPKRGATRTARSAPRTQLRPRRVGRDRPGAPGPRPFLTPSVGSRAVRSPRLYWVATGKARPACARASRRFPSSQPTPVRSTSAGCRQLTRPVCARRAARSLLPRLCMQSQASGVRGRVRASCESHRDHVVQVTCFADSHHSADTFEQGDNIWSRYLL